MRGCSFPIVVGRVLLIGLGLLSACAVDGVEDVSVDVDGELPGLLAGPSPGPDLVQSSVSNPPAAAVNGSSFSVSDTVENIGTLNASASDTRYYLSLNGVNIVGSVPLGSRSVGALASGATNSGTATATIEEGMAQGTYYVLACADRTNAVAEVDDNNNCIASSTTMVVSAPDLIQSNVSSTPAMIGSNGTIDITETVSNITTTGGGTSITRFYFSTDNVKSSDDAYVRACVEGAATPGRNVPSLAGGATSTGTTTVELCVRDATGLHVVAAGTYYVVACADETKAVAEHNEKNNCAVSATSFEVTGAPVCGNNALETGEECDDGNTSSGDGCSATCMAEAAADLIETAVSNPPSTANVTSSFSVTDTVENISVTTAGSSTTRYYLSLDQNKSGGDPELTGSRAVPSLAMNATSSGTVSVTVPSQTAAGTYYLLACADANSAVVEMSETNNCIASTTTVVIGGADLITSEMSNPPATASPGSSFSVIDRVANIGSTNAGQTITKYYLSLNGVQIVGAGPIGQRTVLGVLAGGSDAGSATVTLPAGTAEGTYYVIACADRSYVVSETNENNNCRASATTVLVSAPDLTQSNVSVAPTTVSASGSITVTETVNNITTSTAGTSITTFFLSLDNVRNSGDAYMWTTCNSSGTLSRRNIPSLAGGDSSTGSTTMPLCVLDSAGYHPVAPGTYFILACADRNQTVSEASETNNCTASATTFTVTQ